MGELGADGPRLHRETGRIAAEAGADVVITCGVLAGEIAEGAREAGVQQVCHFETLPALIESLPGVLQEGDCVLVKASHSMKFENVVAALEKL